MEEKAIVADQDSSEVPTTVKESTYDISVPIAELVRRKTFSGYFLARMDRQSIQGVPWLTAGVGYKDYKLFMVYNPEFMESLSFEDQITVMEHEAMHIIHKHVFFSKEYLGEDKKHVNPTVLNYAYDFAVNSYLTFSKESSNNILLPAKYNLPPYKSHLFYLNALLDKMNEIEEQEEAAGISQTGCRPMPGSDGNPKSEEEAQKDQQEKFDGMFPSEKFDELARGLLGKSKMQKFLDNLAKKLQHHWDVNNKDLTEQEKEFMQHVADSLVSDAENACERDQGNFPGNLQQRLKALRKKPLPWEVILKQLIQNCVHTSYRPAYNRRNRMYNTYPGKKRETKAKVVLAIDTSGSVSDTELSEFFNEINHIYDIMKVDLDVIECDMNIQKGGHYKYRKGNKINISGRGGTSFIPVFKYIKDKHLRPDVLVYFTDGYGDAPPKAPREYISVWVYTKNYSKQDWGIHLELKLSNK